MNKRKKKKEKQRERNFKVGVCVLKISRYTRVRNERKRPYEKLTKRRVDQRDEENHPLIRFNSCQFPGTPGRSLNDTGVKFDATSALLAARENNTSSVERSKVGGIGTWDRSKLGRNLIVALNLVN